MPCLQVNKALMRRRLLDDTTLSDPTAYALSNQVDVLFELDSDNSTATDAVMSELALAVSNGTSSAIPVRRSTLQPIMRILMAGTQFHANAFGSAPYAAAALSLLHVRQSSSTGS